MKKRYLVTITFLIDVEDEKINSADNPIDSYTSMILQDTGLPVKTKCEPLPSPEEIGDMSIEEFNKWARKMPV